MRTLHTDKIIEAVKEMCISANLYLAEDMDSKIRQAAKEEDSTLGKQILNQLIENMEIAGEDQTPICQDTGMAVFFVNVGQDLHIEGMNLTDAYRCCQSIPDSADYLPALYSSYFQTLRNRILPVLQ